MFMHLLGVSHYRLKVSDEVKLYFSIDKVNNDLGLAIMALKLDGLYQNLD